MDGGFFRVRRKKMLLHRLPPSLQIWMLTAILAFGASLAFAYNQHVLEKRVAHTDDLLTSVYDAMGLNDVRGDMAASTAHAVRVLAVNGELVSDGDRVWLRVHPEKHEASSVFLEWLRDRRRSSPRGAQIVLLFRGGDASSTKCGTVESISGGKREGDRKYYDVRLGEVRAEATAVVAGPVSPADATPKGGGDTAEGGEAPPRNSIQSVCTYTVIYRT